MIKNDMSATTLNKLNNAQTTHNNNRLHHNNASNNANFGRIKKRNKTNTETNFY